MRRILILMVTILCSPGGLAQSLSSGTKVHAVLHEAPRAEPVMSVAADLALIQRRQRLSNPARAQCKYLDQALSEAEKQESEKKAPGKVEELKRQYRLIGC